MRIVDYDLYSIPPKSQLVRLESDTGLIGWGEAIIEGKPHSTAAAVRELLDSYLLNTDPRPIERHWQRMYRGSFYRGGPILMAAIAGIDQALWDLKGKHYDAPVYELLGGRARDRIQLYRHVNADTPSEHATIACEAVNAGHQALKTAIPKQPFRRVETPTAVAEAIDIVHAIREAIDDNIMIGVDFHGRVSKSLVNRLAEELQPYDPMFYEEPIRAEQNETLRSVAAATSIPIATGERMFSRWDFKQVFTAGTIDIAQPDVSHAGGITEVKKIADMAEAHDVALAPHCPLGPVSLAACLQIDACSPNALIQEEVVHEQGIPDWVTNPSIFKFDDSGYVSLPTGPGLGIEIDREKLRTAAENDEEWWGAPLWSHEDGSVAEW